MKRKADRFRNARGQLTPYALACGYQQEAEKNNQRVQLYHENGCLHVRAHDHSTGKRLMWQCPETLTAARKLYAAAVRDLGNLKPEDGTQ